MSLTTDLIAFWKLDELAGNARQDSVGATTWRNITASATRRESSAVVPRFEIAESQSLSIDDNADLSTGAADFTFALWVWIDDVDVENQCLLSKWHDTLGQAEYALYYNNPALMEDRLSFGIDNGSSQFWAHATNAAALSAGAWHFVAVWQNSAGGQIFIQVDNGAANSAFAAGGAADGANPFRLGVDQADGYLGGRLDAVGFWKRLLSDNERADLWNNGDGMEYPFEAPLPERTQFRRTASAAHAVPDAELAW